VINDNMALSFALFFPLIVYHKTSQDKRINELRGGGAGVLDCPLD
jgi:hypothetical protein